MYLNAIDIQKKLCLAIPSPWLSGDVASRRAKNVSKPDTEALLGLELNLVSSPKFTKCGDNLAL